MFPITDLVNNDFHVYKDLDSLYTESINDKVTKITDYMFGEDSKPIQPPSIIVRLACFITIVAIGKHSCHVPKDLDSLFCCFKTVSLQHNQNINFFTSSRLKLNITGERS